MNKWILKAIVQKTISFLPFKHQINFFFQKYITKGVFLGDEYFEDRLIHAFNHIKGFKKFSNDQIPDSSFELGTGWYPVVPFAFYLCGVNQIKSIDIAKLTNKERLITTLKKFDNAFIEGNKKLMALPLLRERIDSFKKIISEAESHNEREILSKLNLELIIGDASLTAFDDNTFNLTHSNNTFEHVYPFMLEKILKEFIRITKKPNGLMSHFIDMSDHFAHFDKTISIYNFLQFSNSQWKWIDNSIQPLNRLRINDYCKLYEKLNIPVSETESRLGNLEELNNLKVADMFHNYSNADLAVSHSYFRSKF